MTSSERLIQQVKEGATLRSRREAAVDLLASEQWRRVLDEELLCHLGYHHGEKFIPDLAAMAQLAPLLGQDEEKLQRLLEKLDGPCTVDLLGALSKTMGDDLVDLLLAHLRTASGERALLLLKALHRADTAWSGQRSARRVIRRLLAEPGEGRQLLLETLAAARAADRFVETLREYPPACIEEWRALGRSGCADEGLINLALASFRYSPEALSYLLRLDPLPPRVAPRVMAAARPLWLIDALELAVVEKLEHPLIIPLAELGIRLGGRPMAMAGAWLSATRLTIPLMECLEDQIRRNGGEVDQISNLLWVRRNAPSADRALERGRRGEEPDPMDAAALVRQLRGEEVLRLSREILSTPYPSMMENILRPLCGVYLNAAMEVASLAEGDDPAVAARAKEAMSWPDVEWG